MTDLKSICLDILKHLGVSLISEAGHGKSYLAFELVKEFIKMGIPVYIFSPSNVWLKRYGKINYITVGNKDYNPIVRANDNLALFRGYSRDTIQINLDKKWKYRSNGWLEKRLASKQPTLFNVRYLNGRRIKYFIATALKHLYRMQSQQANPEPLIIVLEEAQNPFGTYSMNDDLSLELMTVFTQSRSDGNIHYIVIGQRLNDISTKIVERLRSIIGYTIGQNSLRKIKAQLPKHLKHIPQELKAQTWLYLNGSNNPIFRSPTFKAEGKPLRLTIPIKPLEKNELWRKSIPKAKRKTTLWQKIKRILKLLTFSPPTQSDFPKKARAYPRNFVDEEEDIGEEHAGFLADNEEEEEEALYW